MAGLPPNVTTSLFYRCSGRWRCSRKVVGDYYHQSTSTSTGERKWWWW